MSDIDAIDYFGVAFLILLFVMSMFEIGIILVAYFYADKVECNLLWCTFIVKDKTEYVTSSGNSVTYVTTSSSSTCYINGAEVNCSEIERVS